MSASAARSIHDEAGAAAVTRRDDAVARAVRATLGGVRGRVLLAVSGGLDSMVLLDAAAAVARHTIAAVATFDHGTGAAARAAAEAVAARAAALGVPLVRGRASEPAATEAAWREARWRFLRDAARASGASAIASAHTADDQIETVFLRALRGAGARGLAALAAESPDVVRPLLRLRRAEIARYAARRGVAHVEDPSNASRRHLRNRARLDLLPAIERARPGFAADLLAIGERAAAWRREVDALAARIVDGGDMAPGGEGGRVAPELRVRRDALAGLPAASLAVLWPALAARAGVALDRRGTERLAAFTIEGRPGGVIQLSGNVQVMRRGEEFVLRRRVGHTSASRALPDDAVELPREAGALPAVVGAWRFVVADDATRMLDDATGGLWSFWLPAGEAAVARPWRSGDRMRSPTSGAARRVKRFFGDAGVAGVDRAGWPVVVVNGEIVWIPGVRRAHAAPARSDRPGVWLTCRTVRESTHR